MFTILTFLTNLTFNLDQDPFISECGFYNWKVTMIMNNRVPQVHYYYGSDGDGGRGGAGKDLGNTDDGDDRTKRRHRRKRRKSLMK